MSSTMSPQVPKRASFFRKRHKPRNKSRDKRHRHPARLGDSDERNPDIPIPAQASTTRQPQPINHSEPQVLGDKDAWKRRKRKTTRDRKPDILLSSPTIDHEAKCEEDQTPFITPEDPSIDYGKDMQSREAGHRGDPDISNPKGVPTIATKLQHPVDRGDRVAQRGDAPSTPLLQPQGLSNVVITGGNFYDVRGNATIIQFVDDAQRNLICDHIANLTVLPDLNNNLKKHVLTQAIISLPRAEAVFNDYQTKKKSGPCFEGTRVALLREIADWATGPDESRMYVLSGLAGTGKSTVAYTIASRAADLNLLGASYFFSRDEADCNNAKRFFTTIAYQLCVHNETFAKAIGDVLMTERGSMATTKNPQDQLQALILEPLRSIVQSCVRPILIVVDALDECDRDDERDVVRGLTQLVRELPCFKVILTTRPQPHLDRSLSSQDGHTVFHLQDVEDNIVDNDIRLYLKHNLSLEAIQERYPQRQWYASDEDIDSLVHAAGRLFIIASIAVRHILDKSASNPAAQMQKLLRAFARYHTPFKDLDHFYTVILRDVVPEDCDNDDTVSRYQSAVGSIIFLQRSLSVSALAHLININVVEIYEVLDNLQSVILLGNDNVPRIYHKSFSDYLTDRERCKDTRLQIDTRIRHTQIATRCFEIMDTHLKRNILGLGNPTRFMSNEDGLKEDGIAEQLQKKIPQYLRYACIYWANHLEIANVEDTDLINGLEKFVDEHLLHWFEVLSLIEHLDLAHNAIGVVLKLLKSTSSDLHQLLSDALRFIGKFYKLIERSALHTYHSALPFTPSDSLLYRRYIKEAKHNLCSIEGGPEKWDALVANMSHGEPIDIIKFSLGSTLFVSCSQGKLKIWDAATGTPISMIPGHRFAVANDFSTFASSDDKAITFYNVKGSARGTMSTPLSKIEKLALSSESSRVAAALSDRTVWFKLWDNRDVESINPFDGSDCSDFFIGSECLDGSKDMASQLEFSPTGTRLAYSSANGIKLRDGISGRFIADLRCGSLYKFEFSWDGSRIASLSRSGDLKLWNSGSGGLIAAAKNVGQNGLAISTNGSLLATADLIKVKLWSENRDHLVKIKVLEVEMPHEMAFSRDTILAIATISGIRLYNVKTHTLISSFLTDGYPTALAFSPDSTRLTVGTEDGGLYLWDIRGIDASGLPSTRNATAVTALALSRDCSRLACGFGDGAVRLWEMSPTKRRITPLDLRSKMGTMILRFLGQSRHAKSVQALGFGPDGKLFASGSGDGTIKVWNGEDGTLRGTFKVPSTLQTVALSNSMLVAGWHGGATLWSLDTMCPDYILKVTFKRSDEAFKVSFAENSTLIAVCLRYRHIAVIDVVNCTTIATCDAHDLNIHTMSFLPDNSQLVIQSDEGVFQSFNIINHYSTECSTFGHLIQLPNTSLWHEVPIWHCQDKEQHYFAALFSEYNSPVPVLWIPREIPVTAWAQGSSMIALACKDGGVILIRLSTSHAS